MKRRAEASGTTATTITTAITYESLEATSRVGHPGGREGLTHNLTPWVNLFHGYRLCDCFTGYRKGLAQHTSIMSNNFTVIIDGVLAGMACPGRYEPLIEDLEFLMEEGIGAICSLTIEPLDPELIVEFEVRYIHLPVPDYTPPTLEQVERFEAFQRQAEADGIGTVVHCDAGIGRTGTMLACALVSRGSTAVEAINELRAFDCRYIETEDQEALVHKVERKAVRESHGA